MGTKTNKAERIEIRISKSDKMLLQKAQEISGDSSISSFVNRILKKESEKIIADQNKIIASERDRNIFFDAVFADSTPNKALKKAAKKYKNEMQK